jgi:polysaccharide chain length determinant protein (PEP-CTERM system associated)
MEDLRYYFAIFRRRLPYFLIVATILSAISVIVAYTLPPAYESRMVLLVESPQIPENLAASTVQTPAFEQLQILEQRLMTRENMLDIARKFAVLPDLNEMSPDEIVAAMRARTKFDTSNRFRNEAPLMTISFEAPRPRTTAEVLNEYLLLIQQRDTEFRKGRSGETLDFFIQEVERLGEELDAQSGKILEFKQANTQALPESLEFRMDQQSTFQDRLIQIERDIADLRGQRSRLIQLYELTGDVDTSQTVPQSADQRQLEALNVELRDALAVYSAENPRVKMLQTRIDQLEDKIGTAAPAEPETAEEPGQNLPPVLTIQLEELDNAILALENQKTSLQTRLDALSASIEKTPEVAIVLEEMTRKYETVQAQYSLADDRLSKAQIGDRIETRSRGQRIAVIEQPSIPSEPTKPNRLKLAGAGTALGILAGLGFIFLLEVVNTSARRPEDIVRKLGVTPLTTIPYIQTRAQRFRQRSLKLLFVLVILVGIPAMVYAVHTYYLPLDLIADKIMNKLGVRL